jgi:hypothetical protein
MSDRPTPEDARRDSLQEAIEKITGVRPAGTDDADNDKPAGAEAAHQGEKK